jgi:uncharacterized repeat protein (TIGR02543 family)
MMKRKQHRIVAALLALVLCLGLLPAAALAKDDYETIRYFLGSSTAQSLSESEFNSYGSKYGLCTLTRVIQWSGKSEEKLENLVLKGQEMALTKPAASSNMTFGDWTYADGTVFTGSISKDTTIYLKEVKATASYQVSFDLGGASGTVPATQTITSGGKAKKPTDPSWSGHKFEGWYTSSGTAWNFSTAVTGSMKLTARWSVISSGTTEYTVTLNANGGTGDYTATQKVASGKTASLPTDLVRSGYYLEGWYDQAGIKYTSSTPITANCTLTAKWSKDTFSFANVKVSVGTQYFNSTYSISKKYLEYLKNGETNSVRYSTGETIAFKEYIQRNSESAWNGSCFGMAAVYCLAYAGNIDADVFQSNARGLIDLPYPSQSTSTNDLINFYYLTQFTYKITKQFSSNSGLTTSERNSMVVNAMKSTNNYVILTFTYGKGSGHAIVGTGYTIEGNTCVINIWNPNYPTLEGKLEIPLSGDSAPSFTSDTKGAATYNVKLKFTGAFTVESSKSTYDAKNLQQYITGKTSSSSITTQSVSYTLLDDEDMDFAVLTTSVADFTLTSADGTTAVIEDGDVVSGDMDVERSVIYGGFDDTCTYFLTAKDAAKLEVETYGQDADIQLLANDQYASVTANGLNSVLFDGTSVKTECKSATEQTISISSDLLGDTWNKVTVTGTDTALTVTPESGGVKVSSRNNISVSVQGTNVDSQEKTTPKTVAVTASGVTVSTSGSDMQADPATVENPFTDVASDAYYIDPVLWAVSKNITTGTTDTTFSPDKTCTRAQIITFLWRAADEPEPTGSNPFTDVAEGEFYYKAAVWAAEQGIVSGTEFAPNDPCTRAMAVEFIWLSKDAPSAAQADFTDVSADASYAKAVDWALETGVTTGTTDTTFSPEKTCTRAQIVTFLYRASDK